MNTKATKRTDTSKTAATGGDPIGDYSKSQSTRDTAICNKLRVEIDAALPNASSKIWHGSPVWFIGENPVVGYKFSAIYVNLLFWSGQSFGKTSLKPVGKFAAAQIQFTEISEIDPKELQSWLEKAGTRIWDYRGHFSKQRALQKKTKR